MGNANWDAAVIRSESCLQRTSAIETPQLVIQAGVIRNLDHEEEFPVLKFALQKTPEKQISIVWVMNDGKAAAVEMEELLTKFFC